jgi:hypothetical protein
MTLAYAAGLVLLAQTSPLRAAPDPIHTHVAVAGGGDDLFENPLHAVQYTIQNTTGAAWIFAEVTIFQDPDDTTGNKGNNSKGTVEVKIGDKWGDILNVGKTRTIAAGQALVFQVKQALDGKVSLGLKVTSPEKVDYPMYLSNLHDINDTTMSFPKNVKIHIDPKGPQKSWVVTDQFKATGLLKIQDPAKR